MFGQFIATFLGHMVQLYFLYPSKDTNLAGIKVNKFDFNILTWCHSSIAQRGAVGVKYGRTV